MHARTRTHRAARGRAPLGPFLALGLGLGLLGCSDVDELGRTVAEGTVQGQRLDAAHDHDHDHDDDCDEEHDEEHGEHEEGHEGGHGEGDPAPVSGGAAAAVEGASPDAEDGATHGATQGATQGSAVAGEPAAEPAAGPAGVAASGEGPEPAEPTPPEPTAVATLPAEALPADSVPADPAPADPAPADPAPASPAATSPAAAPTPAPGPRAARPGRFDPRAYTWVDFDPLIEFDYPELVRVDGAPPPELPAEVRALSGKRIAIEGFMNPLAFDSGGVKEFSLVKDPSFCCFGVIPQMNHWIHVTLPDGERTEFYSFDPVAVYGVLEVGEEYQDGYVVSLYRIHAEKVDGDF